MKIRQYTAATMQEAILKIKVDLGPSAVILHTRKFKRGGFLGLFAVDMVEVLAAVDPNEGKVAAQQQHDGAAIAAEAMARASAQREASAREKESSDIYERPRVMPEVRSTGRHPEEIELGPLASGRSAPERAPARAPELERVAADRGVSYERAAVQERPPTPAPAPAPPAPDRQAELRRARLAEQARANGVILLDDDDPPPLVVRGGVTMMPDHIADEVQDLKTTVGDLKAMLVNLVGKLDNQPRTPAQFPTNLQKVYDRLLALDVEQSIARGLTVYLQKEQPHLTTFEAMCDALEVPVGGLVKTSAPLKVEKGECKIIALVGATGVGKTTTIAKLAANFALQRHVDMALLTIDTYRVAAIEQLKTYGDIIGLPVEVVLTPQTLKEALKLHSDKGMILIDTAGRSPYNRLHINELRTFMDIDSRIETHLVLSAATRLSDLKQIVKNFASCGIDRLIFTKTDETDVVGGIISIGHETGIPVSYITTGQSVPDDIESADGPTLAKLLITELKA